MSDAAFGIMWVAGAVISMFVFSAVVTYRGGRMMDHPEVIALIFWPVVAPVMLALFGGPALGRLLRAHAEQRRVRDALRLRELELAERELEALLHREAPTP